MQDNKYWFFGSKLNSVLLFVLIVLVSGAIYIMLQNKETYLNVFHFSPTLGLGDSPKPSVGEQEPLLNKEGISGNANIDDLISFSISPYTKVHGILSYRGVIKGGYFFEANILINILDAKKNILKKSNAVATTEWTTAGPVSFEGNIDFNGLPKGFAYFQIENDNASGLPQYDKSILIPITIE
jgi:hypothetical protein